jgi:hypothetical protein
MIACTLIDTNDYFSFFENLNTDWFEILMNKIFSVNYIKFEASDGKLSVCSCEWSKHCNCCGS